MIVTEHNAKFEASDRKGFRSIFIMLGGVIVAIIALLVAVAPHAKF